MLFEKTKIGEVELKNKFLMSAAAGWHSDGNGNIVPGNDMIHYEIAAGGPAMIITGGVIVHKSGAGKKSALLDNDERIAPFINMAEKIHQNGAKACFQITHGGLWAGFYVKSMGVAPFAPSFIINDTLCEYHSSNREMLPADNELISNMIKMYGDAASRAKKAGFDAVEIHAAHESLPAQFLSPITNLRKDKWGGSVESRVRFHREVLRNVREKTGPGFPILIKLGLKDWFDDGLTLSDGIAAAKLIADDGTADAIEISQGLSGSIKNFKSMSIKTGINSLEDEAYYREWTRQVKKAVGDKAKVIIQGGLRTPSLIREIIEEGEADLASMCRPYLREPALIDRWESGDGAKAKCVSCNQCAMNIMKGQLLSCPLRK